MKIILANPRGFCAGVNMAIESLEHALELFGTPLYVYHEIVHNRPIVERFRQARRGLRRDIAEVPAGGTVLYSAHGVSPEIRQHSVERNLRAIDATCPLVTKVHLEAVRFARRATRSSSSATRARRGDRHDGRGPGEHGAGRGRRGRGSARHVRPTPSSPT